MIGFRGISDGVQSAEDEAAGPTKEAQEARNLALYEVALQQQRVGCDEAAAATFRELLQQPLLRQVDVEVVAQEGRVDSAPLLKYLCFKNMAVLATKRRDWAAAVDSFAKAVSVDGTDVVVWYRMGVAAYSGRYLSVARYALEQGLGVNPQHWLTAKLLVKVFSAMGNDVASRALEEYVRSADRTYHIGQAVDSSQGASEIAPEAKRQRTTSSKLEQSICTTGQRVKLSAASLSWQDLAQELITLAEKSVRPDGTSGFRRTLNVEIVTAESDDSDVNSAVSCATDPQPTAVVDPNQPNMEKQASPKKASDKTSPENFSVEHQPDNRVDSQGAEEGQSTPGSTPRKSERKKRTNRRTAGGNDGQRTAAAAGTEKGDILQIQRATLRLAKFVGVVPEGVNSSPGCSTPSNVHDAAHVTVPTESAAPSLRKFVDNSQRENRSLLSIIRMVLTELCSDVQCLLPDTLAPKLLRLHSILEKHSALGLCKPCSLFLAELYFSAHQSSSDDETKMRMLRQCCDLIGSIYYDEPRSDTSDECAFARTQARLCWLRGKIAESAQKPSTAHACFVSCLAWIQQAGIHEIVVANTAVENSISARTVQQKLGALNENEHTEKISRLFSAGQYDEFTAEVVPRLDKKKVQATPQQWCTLLKQLLVSCEKTSRWDLLLRCHGYRLQCVLSTKCDATCRRILRAPDTTTKPSSDMSVVHEVQILLSSLRRCAKFSDKTWCSPTRATELICLVARGIEILEAQSVGSAATQPLLTAWECFARLWAIANLQPVPTVELISNLGTYVSLAQEIKRACQLEQTTVSNLDVLARQSLVRVLAVDLLKLLRTASEDGSLDQDTRGEDTQDTSDIDTVDVHDDARELLDWCLFDLHGIEFPPETTGSHQQRQKKDKDHSVNISPGMEDEEAFHWYWYAGRHDFTSVLGKFAKKWKDLQLQFIDLVQKASKDSFPRNHAADLQIDAIILGTQAAREVVGVENADLVGTKRIHLHLHHEHATIKHSYMNQTFFEDNSIDQTTRRGKFWGQNWDKELRELAVLYRRDLSINPTRADSWQSLGQCYFRLLDNLLDQHVMGNIDPVQDHANVSADIFCGSAMEYNERARNCFLRAFALDPSSHVPLDLLGFLAFVQIRHGYRHESIVADAVDRFTKADTVAQQNSAGADEWMYPFMLGKLRELQGAPPTIWMPLYWTAKRRHKEMCDKTDKAEIIYRLHASRLKAALALGEDDVESWRLLLRQKSTSTAADDLVLLQSPLVERRQAVVDSAVSKLLGLLKKGERNAWGLEGPRHVMEGMKWFYKSRYAVAAAFLQLGQPQKAAKQLGALFDTEKERARHFWKMHTYKLTDFGDFSFITERHYDRWRMKCLYLYVQLLSVLQDKSSATARDKCAEAEKSLLLATQRQDKAESSSSKRRWQEDVTKARAEFQVAQRDAARGQLLKLERALKRGNDKRVMNRRWTDEGRHVAMAARYVVLVTKTEKLEEKDDAIGVPEVVARICDAVEQEAESNARPVLLVAELSRADLWLRDVYELYCSIRTYTMDTTRAAPGTAESGDESGDSAANNEQKGVSPELSVSDEGNLSTAAHSVRCFSELVASDLPPLENLSAKKQCLHHLSERGININDFSESQVLCLLQRRFSRFISAASGSAPVLPSTIVSYCEKVFGKIPTENKALVLTDIAYVHSHIKGCAEAAAAAAEKSRQDQAAKAKLAAATARENAAAEVSVPPRACVAPTGTTAVRKAPSAERTSGSALPAPLPVPSTESEMHATSAQEANLITVDKARQLREKFSSGGPKAVGKWFEKQRSKERKACEKHLGDLRRALNLVAGRAKDDPDNVRLTQAVAQCEGKLAALQLRPKRMGKRKNAPHTQVVDFEVTVRAYLYGKKLHAEPCAPQKPRLAT